MASLRKTKRSQVRSFLTKPRRLKMPYLDLYIRLPLLDVRTDLMMTAIERNVYEYIGLYVRFWKWSFTFRLYEPGVNRIPRKPRTFSPVKWLRRKLSLKAS